MSGPVMAIRVVATVAELKKALAEGKAEIVTTTAAMQKMAAGFRGDQLQRQAMTIVASVHEIGGAAKLTESEQARVNVTVGKAIEKYRLFGQEAPAAMVALHDATKRVEQPTSTLGTFMSDLKGQILGTAAGMFTAQAAIGAVSGGFRMLTGFVSGSIESYAAAEAAQKTMTVALRAQGMAVPEVIDQYNALATAMQRQTVVSDDAATQMQATLIQVGDVMPSKMEAALKASANLSAGLGIDLQTATMLVAKAAAGHTESLGKYGIQVSESKLKSEGFSAVLAALNDQFGGQAQGQLNTYNGRLQQIANNWDNLKEAAGKAIVTQSSVVTVLNLLSQKSGDAESGFARLTDGVISFGNAVLRYAVPGGRALSDQIEAGMQNATMLAAIGVASEQGAQKWDAYKQATIGATDADRFAADAQAELAAIAKAEEEATKLAAAATKRAAEENAKFAENLKTVLQLSKGYQANLDTINGSVVEAIKYYREQGIEMQALGEMYGLTSVQVKALTDAETAETAMLTALTRGNENLATAMAARNQLQRQSVEVMDEARGRTTVGPLTGGANAQLEAVRGSLSYRAREFSQNFGAVLKQDLPANIMAAITGGGSVWKAAGSTLGGFLVSDQGLGSTLKKGLTSALGSSLGGAVSAMLPGIGALAGPLLEKLFSMGGPSEQELAGRTAAANFEKGVAAGLNAQQRAEAGGRSWAMTVIGVRDAYLAVGRTAAEAEAAVEAMWAAERQGPEAVAAVQAGMQTVMDQATRLRQAAAAFGPSQTELRQLATDAQQTYQFMLQSGVYTADQLAAAFKASQEAQVRALGINTDAQKKSMDMLKTALTDLTQKRDALWQQIAAEAPEDVMGVVEAGARAQLATMDAMIAAQQAEQTRQADAYAAEVAAALASIQDRIQPIIVPIVYDQQPFPGSSVGLDPIPMAAGGFGEVTGPTLFLAGEKGRREQVAFSGADRTFADRGFGGGGSDGTVRAIEQLQRTIETQNSRMPQLIGLAVRDAVVGQRGARR